MVIQIDPALHDISGQRTENNTAEGWLRPSDTDHDRPTGPIRMARRRHAAVLAATASSALSIVGMGGAQTAFAAEGAPGAAAVGQIAAAEVSCLARLTTENRPTTSLAEWQATHSAKAAAYRKAVKGHGSRKRRHRHGAGHDTSVESTAHQEAGGWRVVVAKAEGSYTTVLAIDGSAQASGTCLTGPGSSQPVIGMGIGGGGEQNAVPPARKIGGVGFGGTRTPDEQFHNDASGRVGAGVSAVKVVLIDGTRVPSKIENGWFLATWTGGGTGRWTDPRCIYEIEAVAEGGETTTTVASPLGERAAKAGHRG